MRFFYLTCFFGLTFSVSASATDACAAPNRIEVAAALRGPGVIAAMSGHSPEGKTSICHQKRTAMDRTRDVASLHEAPGPELILLVTGPGGSPLIDPKAAIAETSVPNLGDRATVYTGSLKPLVQGPNGQSGYRVSISKGAESIALLYAPNVADRQSRDTAIQLAHEVLEGGVDGQLASYPIAEKLLLLDRTTVTHQPDSIQEWNELGVYSQRLKRYADARAAYSQLTKLRPTDPGPYFGIAVADWTSYRDEVGNLTKDKSLAVFSQIASDPRLSDLCQTLRKDQRVRVEEGFANAKRAFDLHPTSSDYAAYLVILAHAKANTDCGDAEAIKADDYEADHWAEVAIANRKIEQSSGERFVSEIEVDPGLAPAPPPPPPQEIGGTINSTPVSVPHGSVQRVRIASDIVEGLLIRKVQPVYPQLARQARIQGSVMLKAEISKDGTIENLGLISGHPMLVAAAIDAVKQWVYRPYVLKGQSVAVETQIEISFSLSAEP